MPDKDSYRFHCMRCGHEWESPQDPKQERTCPKCKSNSVRYIKSK